MRRGGYISPHRLSMYTHQTAKHIDNAQSHLSRTNSGQLLIAENINGRGSDQMIVEGAYLCLENRQTSHPNSQYHLDFSLAATGTGWNVEQALTAKRFPTSTPASSLTSRADRHPDEPGTKLLTMRSLLTYLSMRKYRAKKRSTVRRTRKARAHRVSGPLIK